ncbi:MAG: peptidoglycan D,D-transpeptidase FtsI family protein [Candidatus Geothermincolia bacterium]
MATREARDKRIAIVTIVLLVGLGIVTFKLVLIQGIQAGHYKKLASDQRDTTIKITPRRGTITDREGEIMAISQECSTVYATPYLVKDKKRVAAKIADVLGEDAADVQKKLEAKNGFVYLARKLDKPLADRLKKMELTGIGFVEESKRFYPLGSLASQLLGVVDVDNKGQAGLELYYEDLLGGKTGEVMLEKDAAGNPIPGSERNEVNEVDGVDLQLTLDKDIQASMEDALAKAAKQYGAKAATAIVMDCNTGDILAMASCPTFDPNNREKIDPAAMRTRAITDVYEPGSCLKIVTAVAALQTGVVNPDTVMQVPSELKVADATFKDAEPQPTRQLPFSKIISQSSNVGTIQTALKVGDKQLSEYMSLFGLGHKTGVDFPGEVGGILPPLASWTGTSAATISIGQGVSVTPMQVACVAGTVANGGRKICPHFMKAKISGTGVHDMGLGGLGEEILTKDTCQKMTGIMEQVLAPDGTAPKAAVNYYRVAGKTGTAEKPNTDGAGYSGTYMATFVGFAPAERPRIVCMVVLDEPTPIWGGETAAPVFRTIMSFSLQHLKISPSWGNPPAANGGNAVAGSSQAGR